MPAALRRITDFSRRYSEDDPVGRDLCNAAVASFAADRQAVTIILILDGAEIVGHLLLSVDKWLQRDVLSIVQFQLDRALPRDFVRVELERVEAYGRERRCSIVQAFAISEKLARAYRVFHGFDYYATIVRKPLGPGVESGPAATIADRENS